VASLLVLLRDEDWSMQWMVVVTFMVGIMFVLLLLDRSQVFVVLAGTLIFMDMVVASLIEGMGILELWSLLAMGLFSIILGVASIGQSRMLDGTVIMDREQKRLFLREMLRAVGVSVIAIVGVMVISLGVLSLTFLADQGISSAVIMAFLAIVAMLSIGALVALRERI
jgi:hypothetical protein